MSLTLIGLKKGMAQVFDQDGKLVVCTVIQAEPNTVLQIKRKETHGYNGIQVGGVPMNQAQAARAKKPILGHFAKIQVQPCREILESRVDNVDQYQVGQKLDVSIFAEARFVDIEGVTKGKGYQGVMKLHGMAGGPAAHGSSFHRHMGSTGMRSTPGRCFPGGKRASRMGGDRHTVQNLRVVAVKGDLLLVEGAVPGANSSIVYIRTANKKGKKG
jgi:large subunit ribosomal protein L3